MRSFVVLFAVVSVFVCANADLTQEQKDQVKEYHEKCAAETSINIETVKKAQNGEFPADDAQLKSYVLCMAKLIGFQDANGKIDKDVIKKKVSMVVTDSAALDKLIEQCAIEKATPEETAIETLKCFHQNSPTHVSVL